MDKSKKSPPQKAANDGKARTKKLLIIITAAFLGAVLAFAASVGVISALRSSSYVFKYRGVGIDRGVTNYLCAYYKALYIRELNARGFEPYDDAEFWEKAYGGTGGESYGDRLRAFTESSIKELISASAVFDMSGKLRLDEKEKITEALDERISYLFGGSKKSFNEDAKEYGFDYKDALTASELLYKQRTLAVRIFGEDGTGVFADLDACDEVFSEYSRVKFIFIRTENTLERDENGNPINGNAAPVFRTLSDSEREERLARIEKIKLTVEEINSGITDPLAFDEYAIEVKELYGEMSEDEISGYYLHPGSKFTSAFAESFPNCVSLALELSVGEADFASCDEENGGFEGACFMYREGVPHGTYPYYYETEEDGFFYDFAAIAAGKRCEKMVNSLLENIKISDKWRGISLVDMPYSTKFVPSFS